MGRFTFMFGNTQIFLCTLGLLFCLAPGSVRAESSANWLELLASGQYGRAIATLETIPPERRTATQWGSLGNAYLQTGDFDAAIVAFEHSGEFPEQQAVALSHAHRLRGERARRLSHDTEFQDRDDFERWQRQQEADFARARDWAKRAVGHSPAGVLGARAHIMRARVGGDLQPQAVRDLLAPLPPSREKAFALLELAEFVPSETLFAEAIAAAGSDELALAWAYGRLGTYRQQQGQTDASLAALERAALLSQSHPDLLFRWLHRNGQLRAAMGDGAAALGAYREAINALQAAEKALLRADVAMQIDFQTDIEPVYREYLALLLEGGDVAEALTVVEKLQLSELQFFLGLNCDLIERSPVAAVSVYTIVLPERTYAIVRTPTTEPELVSLDIDAEALEKLVHAWRLNLERIVDPAYKQESRQLYDLLIRPIEETLARHPDLPLAFFHDGPLRNVPMAALLNDQGRYLVEDRAIVTGASAQLASFSVRGGRTALFALDDDSLPAIGREVAALAPLLDPEQYVGSAFETESLHLEGPYKVVHLATHGFSSCLPETSFIEATDRKVYLPELQGLLDEATVELLVLNGCETAIGNRRATLGFAGMALQSGVNGVIGSLWATNDSAAADIILTFYEGLQAGLSAEQALRQLQLDAIAEGLHPIYWSPYTLVQ